MPVTSLHYLVKNECPKTGIPISQRNVATLFKYLIFESVTIDPHSPNCVSVNSYRRKSSDMYDIGSAKRQRVQILESLNLEYLIHLCPIYAQIY